MQRAFPSHKTPLLFQIPDMHRSFLIIQTIAPSQCACSWFHDIQSFLPYSCTSPFALSPKTAFYWSLLPQISNPPHYSFPKSPFPLSHTARNFLRFNDPLHNLLLHVCKSVMHIEQILLLDAVPLIIVHRHYFLVQCQILGIERLVSRCQFKNLTSKIARCA